MEHAPEHLTWFTADIIPDGEQIIGIRPETSRTPLVRLDLAQSRLLDALLNAFAADPAIPFAPARQAALRAFVRIAGDRP